MREGRERERGVEPLTTSPTVLAVSPEEVGGGEGGWGARETQRSNTPMATDRETKANSIRAMVS